MPTARILRHLRGLFTMVLLGPTLAASGDRRIVDRITIGDASSEREHAYAGDGVMAGVAEGRTFRQAAGWIRYALTVFDDTEVTIACTFAGTDTPRTSDLVVENRVVATHTFHSAARSVVEFRVPLEITKGHSNIMVMLRAANGSTPGLVELRSVQDHNE